MESITALNITGLPKIYFGAGKFSELPEIISSLGRNALIIIGGESFKKSGRWNALTPRLNQAQIKYKAVSVWDEPATEVIDAIVSGFRRTPVDVVVAIGGGSVIDFGKAVSAMLVSDGSVKDYLEDVGTKKPPAQKYRLLPFRQPPAREVKRQKMPWYAIGLRAIKNLFGMMPLCLMQPSSIRIDTDPTPAYYHCLRTWMPSRN